MKSSPVVLKIRLFSKVQSMTFLSAAAQIVRGVHLQGSYEFYK